MNPNRSLWVAGLGLAALWLLAGPARGEVSLEAPPAPPAGGNPRATTITVPEPVNSGGEKPRATENARTEDLLKFRNNDCLHGTLLGAGPAGIRWQRSDLGQAINFAPANVFELQLAPRSLGQPRAPHHWLVELTNGDRLPGDVVSLDDQTLTLTTWYAGTLALQRAMVQQISPLGVHTEAVYAGPTSMEGWTVSGNRGAWTYKQGAFYSSGFGGIGRDVNLPESATIECDAAWRGQLFLQVGLYISDVQQPYGGSGYQIMFSQSTIMLQRGHANRGFNNFGENAQVRELMRRNSAHITVRVSKPNKIIAVSLNGKLVKQWTETGEFAGHGTGLMFSSQGQGLQRVSNVTVTTWDGKLETDSAAAATATDDLVVLANGDKISGTLNGIAHNEIAFTTSFAPVKIPLERAALISLAGAKANRPRRQATDVRACFTGIERITMALEKIDGQTVAGTSENCGRLSVPLAACERIQFNIYQPRPESSDDDAWGATDNSNEDPAEQ